MITGTLNTYRDRVPNQPKTPRRSLRINDEDWDELEAVATRLGTDRGKLLKQLVAWYLGRPDVELPERPKVSD